MLKTQKGCWWRPLWGHARARQMGTLGRGLEGAPRAGILGELRVQGARRGRESGAQDQLGKAGPAGDPLGTQASRGTGPRGSKVETHLGPGEQNRCGPQGRPPSGSLA